MSSKLREALENIVNHFCTNCHNDGPDGCELSEVEGRFEFLCHKLKQARAALAEPLRNCDVGTAEEQAERFKAFCNSYPLMCGGCPLKDVGSVYGDCVIHWAQMPYEEVK